MVSSSSSSDESFSSIIQKKESFGDENDNEQQNKNDVIPDGWIVLSKNKSHVHRKANNTNDDDVCNRIVDRLTYTYEKRKFYSILMLGEEIYERTFHFPDT